MCGIVGYSGQKNATSILLRSLKRIEYRGYDSAGISFVDNSGNLKTTKVKGGVDKLREHAPKTRNIHAGIGHTRWATHGEPSVINAHPHQSKNFSLVHNGIIENYLEIKAFLEDKGDVSFVSETDSEILVKLMQYHLEQSKVPLEAIIESLKMVRGTFGLGIICDLQPDKLFVARRGSPIVIGRIEKEFFISSDVATMPRAVEDVTFLNDDEIAVINSKIKIVDLENHDKKVKSEKFNFNREEAIKGGYKHYLIKEINEQPKSSFETLRGRLDPRTPLGSIVPHAKKLKNTESLLAIGCGTAYYSGLLSSYLLEDVIDIPMRAQVASEFIYRKQFIEPDKTLAMIISQSGETADTMSATNKLNQMGVHTHGVVNVIGSSISRITDSGTYVHAGPEISVASTKAFTSQVIAQLLIGLHINALRGHPVSNNEQLVDELTQMPDKIAKTIKQTAKRVEQIANKTHQFEHAMFLGRNRLYPIALEGALKLKEISYMQTEAHPAGEMKHGPLALIDDDMLVVFIAEKGPLLEKSLSNLKEIEARGGTVILITNDENLASQYELSVFVDTETNISSPLLFNLPLQLLAYNIAKLRKLPIDKPRNLAKSVTVE